MIFMTMTTNSASRFTEVEFRMHKEHLNDALINYLYSMRLLDSEFVNSDKISYIEVESTDPMNSTVKVILGVNE